MAGWLKRSREDRIELIPPAEVEALLPSSAKGPEGNRFTRLAPNVAPAGDDEDDEDIDFLKSIARSVSSEKSVGQFIEREPRPQAAAATSASDALDVFRAMQGELAETRFDFKLDDVDMADLLEDLSTTALALKQRKAA